MKNTFTIIAYKLMSAWFLAIIYSSAAFAQNQNGLAFDGTDDLVTTPAASSLIAGSNEISLTCWVYPSNPTPSTTSYDGFCGMRDNATADFYLLHYTATTIEARFRNSAGTTYDISGGGIQLDTWQHLVLTYDGSMLRYYHNGILLDSLAATGNITSTTGDFYMGGLPYLTYIFNLVGKLDEVSLWNKTLSQSEISCIYGSGIDTASVGLQLYYKLNQGTAGGNNTAITTATDASGHIDGTLNNFAMTGSTSNFVTGTGGGTTSVNAGICAGDSYIFGSQVLTVAGTYTDTLSSVNGCDSIVYLTLTVSSVDTSVNLFSTVLHSNQSGATYQWVNCDNGHAPISGATTQNYVLTTGGNYAVIVTMNACTDTSSCHNVTFAGIRENNLADNIHLYPNPIVDYLSISLDQQVRNANIQISDLEGRIIWSVKNNNNSHLKIDASNWAEGIYVLKVSDDKKSTEFRLMKK